MRDQSCSDLAICFTRNMASVITDPAGRSDPNAADVVRCLNALTSLDMRSIATDDVLTSLVTDCFVTRQIGNTDDESDSDSCDDVDIDPPGVFLADEIMLGDFNKMSAAAWRLQQDENVTCHWQLPSETDSGQTNREGCHPRQDPNQHG